MKFNTLHEKPGMKTTKTNLLSLICLSLFKNNYICWDISVCDTCIQSNITQALCYRYVKGKEKHITLGIDNGHME